MHGPDPNVHVPNELAGQDILEEPGIMGQAGKGHRDP